MAHVYVCMEDEEYYYTWIVKIYANKEDAINWLESIDALDGASIEKIKEKDRVDYVLTTTYSEDYDPPRWYKKNPIHWWLIEKWDVK